MQNRGKEGRILSLAFFLILVIFFFSFLFQKTGETIYDIPVLVRNTGTTLSFSVILHQLIAVNPGCRDTDNGFYPLIAGTVTATRGGVAKTSGLQTIVREDHCLSADVLREVACGLQVDFSRNNGNTWEHHGGTGDEFDVNCKDLYGISYGCQSGACVKNDEGNCGNGVIDQGEQCDGTAGTGTCSCLTCSNACTCIPGSCQSDTDCPTGDYCTAAPDCTCQATQTCGNNQREGTEECDGSDDQACPGVCQSDCTCPSVIYDPQFLSYTASLGQSFNNPTFNGNIVYGTSNDFGLVTIDITDRTKPVTLHQRTLDASYNIQAKDYQNPYLYAATRFNPSDNKQNKFYVISNDPLNPTIAASLDFNAVQSLKASGNYVYLLGFDNSFNENLYVVDITTHLNPILRATLAIPQNTNGFPAVILAIDTARKVLFLVFGTQIDVINIANPLIPSIISSFTYGAIGFSNAGVLFGNFLIYADNNKLIWIDTSNLNSLRIDGTLAGFNAIYAIAGKGNYVYVKDAQSTNVYVVDANARTIVKTVNHPDIVLANVLAVKDNTLLVSGIEEGILYDITTPQNPSFQGTAWGNLYDTILSNSGNALYATFKHGLAILDVSNSNVPRIANVIKNGAFQGKPSLVFNGYLYVNDYIYDIRTDPLNPVFVKQLGVSVWDDTAQDKYLYIVDYSTLKIYDISNPSQATLKGTYSFSTGAAGGVAVRGSIAYVALSVYGIAVLDVSDPTNIRLIKTVSPPSGADYARNMILDGNYAYITNRNRNLNGADIYDITIMTDPKYITSVIGGGSAGAITIKGIAYENNHLYLSVNWGNSNPGVYIYDITDRTKPIFIKKVLDPISMRSPSGMITNGNLAAVGDYVGLVNFMTLYH